MSPAERAAQLGRQLDALYSQIPDVGCRGLCSETCHDAIPTYAPEYERLVLLGLLPREPRERFVCPFLADGACTIYEQRPFVCRIHGAVDPTAQHGTPEGKFEPWVCPHGCRPERWLRQHELLSLAASFPQAPPSSFDPTAQEAIDRGRRAGLEPMGYRPLADGRVALTIIENGQLTYAVEAPE